jgi:hypothetical protein
VQKLTLSFACGALIGSSGMAFANLEVLFGTEKDFTQTTAAGPVFAGGAFTMGLQDGQIVINPNCQLNNSNAPFGKAAVIGCPTGSTGLITFGDADDDGVLDSNTYWEVLADTPALYIEPFKPELCQLAAAPASPLNRPLGGFVDDGVISFWNTQLVTMQQYEMARYTLTLPYGAGNGEGRRMARELVPGQYSFTFPMRNNIAAKVGLPVTLLPNMEMYDASSSQGKQGFKFLGNRWKNGYYEVDPRVINTFTWQGNRLNVRPGADFLFLQIQTNSTVFPPNGSPLFIPSVTSTSYSMPPGFFTVGETGTFTLNFQRLLAITGAATDVSERNFSFPIRFIDSYSGYATFGGAFPVGSSSALTKSTADFDKDTFSNATEFALQSDPNDAASTPFDPVAPVYDGPVAATNYVRADNGSVITITIQKRPDTGGSLTYELETTPSLPAKKWTKIKTGTFSSKIHWKIDSETPTQIVFKSDGTVPVNTLIRPVATAKY